MSPEYEDYLLFKRDNFQAFGDDALYFATVQDQRIDKLLQERLERRDDPIIFVGHTAVAGEEEPEVAFRV